MKSKNTNRNPETGRWAASEMPKVKKTASFDKPLYEALKRHAARYFHGNISQAIGDCLDRVLNDKDIIAELEEARAFPPGNNTTTNAPITTTARDSSPTIVGNANNTTIVEKNHDKPSRPSRRRK